MNSTVRRISVLLGALLAAGTGGAVTAQAAGPRMCAADDVVVQMGLFHVVKIDYAQAPLQIFARPGVTCDLQGFPTEWRLRDRAGHTIPYYFQRASATSDPVTVTDGSPAHIPLDVHGYLDESPFTQPNTLSVRLPGAAAPSSMPWPGGELPAESVYFRYGHVEAGAGIPPE